MRREGEWTEISNWEYANNIIQPLTPSVKLEQRVDPALTRQRRHVFGVGLSPAGYSLFPNRGQLEPQTTLKKKKRTPGYRTQSPSLITSRSLI